LHGGGQGFESPHLHKRGGEKRKEKKVERSGVFLTEAR
jgi:hypothetical protein